MHRDDPVRAQREDGRPHKERGLRRTLSCLTSLLRARETEMLKPRFWGTL